MRSLEQRKRENHPSSPFFSPKIQKKLKTGAVGDKYEVEADKVADKVVNNKAKATNGLFQSKKEEEVQQKPISESITPVQSKEMKEEEPVQKKERKEEKPIQKKEEEEPVQKKEMKEEESVQKKEEEEPVQKKEMKEEEPVQKKEEEEPVQKKEMKEEEPVQKKEEEEPVQAKCDDCKKEDKVQKKGKDEEEKPVQAKSNAAEKKSEKNSLENKLDDSKGSGNTMDKVTKNEMEAGFGSDFSNVKVHTDTNAVQMSQEIGAQAFTHGNDIYFNKEKYNPDSKEGKHLLAHELTHTIQQTGAKQKPPKIQKSAINNSASEDLEAVRFQDEYRLEQAHDNLDYLGIGSKGLSVEKAQSGLMDLGYNLPKFGADGDFGNETKKAVLDFQSDNDLKYDGIIGTETIGRLDDIYAGKNMNDSCCGEAFQLPQNNNDFEINNSVLSVATFCSKGNFKITSTANWATPHGAKHYHIVITAIQGGTIDKPSRRFDIGRTETQSFKVKSKDCVFFKVEVKVIDPASSPKLKGSFDVTN
jgi:peptidoglycan hydrolase-like protein with peptidoglycan-binding domain